MKLTMKDGSAISTVQLNVGRTLIELAVQSASGKGMTVYSISVMKSRLPTTVQLKSKNDAFECAVCCGVVLCPSHIKNGPYVYCQPCLEELTRTNKMDPFSGQLLSEEKWFVQDYECEVQLAKEEAVCPQISGEISAPMSQLGPKLLAERIKKDKIEEVSHQTSSQKLTIFLCHNVCFSLVRPARIAVKRYQQPACHFTRRCSALQSTLSPSKSKRFV